MDDETFVRELFVCLDSGVSNDLGKDNTCIVVEVVLPELENSMEGVGSD